MTLATLAILALQVSVFLQVLSLGLKTDLADIGYLARHPSQLLRSLVAMNLIMPLFATLLVVVFRLSTPVEIMLICVALSPVPPLLPRKEIRAGGRHAYGVSLLCCAALVAIFSIPALLELIERVFGTPLRMSPLAVAVIMLKTVFVPLGVGIAARALAPKFAARLAMPVFTFSAAVLPVVVIAIIVAAWPAIIAQLGNGTLLAIAAFVAVGLGVGHALGGPDAADRTVLSLSTASRHPGAAAAIASTNFPEVRAALAVLLIYLIVGGVLSALYLRWRKSAAPRAAEVRAR